MSSTSLFTIASTSSSGGHHGPGWLFVLISVLILAFAITLVINPKLQWKMNRWQFKNPAATEPSSAGLVGIRISSAVVAVVAVVFLVIGIGQL